MVNLLQRFLLGTLQYRGNLLIKWIMEQTPDDCKNYTIGLLARFSSAEQNFTIFLDKKELSVADFSRLISKTTLSSDKKNLVISNFLSRSVGSPVTSYETTFLVLDEKSGDEIAVIPFSIGEMMEDGEIAIKIAVATDFWIKEDMTFLSEEVNESS